jgi:hypothetical protein
MGDTTSLVSMVTFSLPPPLRFQKLLEKHGKNVGICGGSKVVFIIPLPRYVLSGCCKNTDHVSNRLSGELAAEFAGAEKFF